VPRTTVHGSTTDPNACQSSLDPPLQPPAPVTVTVKLESDAFPQPHLGDPITLSNTKATISIPADLLQLGVDIGIISDGMQVPSTIDLVVAGSNTTEGTHTYHAAQTVTLHVVGGKAQPITSILNLENTTWHPTDPTKDVVFSEKSLTIVSTLDLTASLGTNVVATFDCVPSHAPSFVAVGAQGAPATTTTLPSTVTTSGGSVTTAAATPTTVSSGSGSGAGGSGALPRTGASVLFLVALAALLIELGLAALAISGRKLRLHRHRY
jgi:hypothetical protein